MRPAMLTGEQINMGSLLDLTKIRVTTPNLNYRGLHNTECNVVSSLP